MIFLVEDMAVITGAGAEYGETRTKNLHIFIQIHKPLSDAFASIYQIIRIPMKYYFYKYRCLYKSYLLLISASVGVTTARILGTRLTRGCHLVPTQMTHDHPQGNLKSLTGFWI